MSRSPLLWLNPTTSSIKTPVPRLAWGHTSRQGWGATLDDSEPSGSHKKNHSRANWGHCGGVIWFRSSISFGPDNGPGEMLAGTVEVKKCQITEEVKRKNLERRMHTGGWGSDTSLWKPLKVNQVKSITLGQKWTSRANTEGPLSTCCWKKKHWASSGHVWYFRVPYNFLSTCWV